jgi:hypothetical protein
MVYLQITYELCFGEAYFEYFESCDFSRENTNIDVSVFMLDLRMINMSSECGLTSLIFKIRHKNIPFTKICSWCCIIIGSLH